MQLRGQIMQPSCGVGPVHAEQQQSSDDIPWRNAGEESVPLLFGPKAKTRQAIEAAGIPHTYVVSYGLASYWANGLGELSQKDRVPPAPTGDNKVPYFGTGRTKCERLRPSHALCCHCQTA